MNINVKKNTIALVDCNNFFVSCERLFQPKLGMRPVVVLSSNDGCVISRSEEAKALDIGMGEPYFKVRSKCHKNAVAVFSSNFPLYRDLSRRVMYVLRRFSDDVEAYSVDEGFLVLDAVSGDFEIQARNIGKSVFRETGIPVSVGVSHTKTLAKVATHYAKPKCGGDGTKVLLTQQDISKALASLPVGEVWGVGFRREPVLRGLSIHTASDLINMDDRWVRGQMSVCGLRTVQELRGVRCFGLGEDVVPRKSLLHSQSFGVRVAELSELSSAVAHHARKSAEVLRAEGVLAREVGVLLRTSRHSKKRHSVLATEILSSHTNDTLVLVATALSILSRVHRKGFSYAKAGVIVRDIVSDGVQPETTLFGDAVNPNTSLMDVLDTLRHRFGDVVRVGAEFGQKGWHARQTLLSPRYTTDWRDVLTVLAEEHRYD